MESPPRDHFERLPRAHEVDRIRQDTPPDPPYLIGRIPYRRYGVRVKRICIGIHLVPTAAPAAELSASRMLKAARAVTNDLRNFIQRPDAMSANPIRTAEGRSPSGHLAMLGPQSGK